MARTPVLGRPARATALAVLIVASCGLAAARAEPYVPADDDEVLLELDEDARPDLALLDDGMGGANLSGADRVVRARHHLQQALASGTPDGFGRAQALLEPLLRGAPAAVPDDAALLGAYIAQHEHRFAEALALLDPLLARNPALLAARLQRAQMHLVTGAHAAARADCEALAGRAPAAVAGNCLAQVAAVSGAAQTTHTMLAGLLEQPAYLAAEEAYELRLTLATISTQLGLGAEAAALYKQLHDARPADNFVLMHLCEALLELGRGAEALALLQAVPAGRLSLDMEVAALAALRMLDQDAQAAEARRRLVDKFAVASARGEGFPHKEHARFLLLEGGEPADALAAARANWQLQKEPDDLLLLARAGRAARDAATLAEAADWLDRTGLEDSRVARVLGEAP